MTGAVRRRVHLRRPDALSRNDLCILISPPLLTCFDRFEILCASASLSGWDAGGLATSSVAIIMAGECEGLQNNLCKCVT